ncbi:MAG: Ni/Fe-hydrogenase, b-type cytochrome subunit [Dissulfurimicrobium hydrothermale]|uniref:Ni/Fe-hydrogenase, b-type cytochrome subunit n=1 Tax=Dissulfurimicrobium hydrothermale TaxID=1750598 RepID=UPI003C776ECF
MRATATYEKKKAWGVLLRLFHWAYAITIVILVISGYYIYEPWLNSHELGASFPMASTRYIHFVAGYAFIGAIVVRIYLFFFGNKQERFLDSAPVTPRNIKNLFGTIVYYLYLTDYHEERLGHNALFMLFYIITLFLALVQVLTGLYLLFPENLAVQHMGISLFGTQQEARLVHYFLMWYFIIFTMTHIYITIWNDIERPEGLISSIFNGSKFKPKKA